MNKIILIIFAFLFSFILTSESKSQILETQETFFTIGDTAQTFQLGNNTKYVLITVVDSSLTGTDTIYVKGITGANGSDLRYSLLSTYDLYRTAQATLVTYMSPGNGLTKSYMLNEVPFRALYIVRSNESTDDLYAPKTRIVVTEFK